MAVVKRKIDDSSDHNSSKRKAKIQHKSADEKIGKASKSPKSAADGVGKVNKNPGRWFQRRVTPYNSLLIFANKNIEDDIQVFADVTKGAKKVTKISGLFVQFSDDEIASTRDSALRDLSSNENKIFSLKSDFFLKPRNKKNKDEGIKVEEKEQENPQECEEKETHIRVRVSYIPDGTTIKQLKKLFASSQQVSNISQRIISDVTTLTCYVEYQSLDTAKELFKFRQNPIFKGAKLFTKILGDQKFKLFKEEEQKWIKKNAKNLQNKAKTSKRTKGIEDNDKSDSCTEDE